MLQPCHWTGVLFLFGIALNSWSMFLGAVLGGGVATLTGCALRRSEALKQGLFGFNGALVGIAGMFFMSPSVSSIALIVIAILLSTALAWWAQRAAVPAYTAPFVVSGWLMLLLAPALGIAPAEVGVPLTNGLLEAMFNGVGQVMFQGSVLSGIVFVLGLWLSQKSAALWALVGSAIGAILAGMMGAPSELVGNGIYGFNAALAAVALAGNQFSVRPLLGIVLSVLITHLFMQAGWVALTGPFVLATWLVLLSNAGWRKITV